MVRPANLASPFGGVRDIRNGPLASPLFSGVLSRLQADVLAMEKGGSDPLIKDRSTIFSALGLDPDPWQQEVMECEAKRILLVVARQCGKSRVCACYALVEALLNPPSTILIFSPSQRQSDEMMRKVREAYYALRGDRVRLPKWHKPKSLKSEKEEIQKRGLLPEEEMVGDRLRDFELYNGSRVISLPANSVTTAGYTATLVIIDEAAKMPSDQLFLDVHPMLAASQGRMILLSTPYGKRGYFWETYKKVKENTLKEWELFEYDIRSCPRIHENKEFLEDERLALGDDWFEQEYLIRFLDSVNSVFHYDDIQAALHGTSPLPDYNSQAVPTNKDSDIYADKKVWFT